MQSKSLLTILGSTSGTEPMPGRHHTSFVINHEERLYWFDAGECCSHTAHVMGLDLPATEAIFISHTHMDHIGGLPNLLWTLRKLNNISQQAQKQLFGRTIPIYLPDRRPFDGIMQLLQGTEGNFSTSFTLEPRLSHDGLIFETANFTVEARHNSHMGSEPPWLSFSFAIRVGATKLVYSGDFKTMAELEPLLAGASLLLIETGHHDPVAIATWLRDTEKEFERLLFLHHGRRILADAAGELQKCRAILGDRVTIANDGMTLAL